VIQQYADLLALRKQYLDMQTYVHIIIHVDGFRGSSKLWRGHWQRKKHFQWIKFVVV